MPGRTSDGHTRPLRPPPRRLLAVQVHQPHRDKTTRVRLPTQIGGPRFLWTGGMHVEGGGNVRKTRGFEFGRIAHNSRQPALVPPAARRCCGTRTWVSAAASAPVFPGNGCESSGVSHHLPPTGQAAACRGVMRPSVRGSEKGDGRGEEGRDGGGSRTRPRLDDAGGEEGAPPQGPQCGARRQVDTAKSFRCLQCTTLSTSPCVWGGG